MIKSHTLCQLSYRSSLLISLFANKRCDRNTMDTSASPPRHYTLKDEEGIVRKIDASGWGALAVVRIDRSGDFWALFEELVDDASGFVANRITLLDAFKGGYLYGLVVTETADMYAKNVPPTDGLFCRSSICSQQYLLPCLCVQMAKEAIVIWTHSRARRNGFARQFVCQLGIEYALARLNGSQSFWEHIERTIWSQQRAKKAIDRSLN